MSKTLTKKFFNRPTLRVANDLLGKFLVRRYKGKIIASMITEVEAYDGPKDRASHAYRGITPRTKIMFGEAGVWYVYFIYGVHWMLNAVCSRKDYPAAILIRGVEAAPKPGKLTKYFHIDKSFNGKKIAKSSGLWIEDRGVKRSKLKIKRSKRIGVDYAGKYWSGRLYRFNLDLM